MTASITSLSGQSKQNYGPAPQNGLDPAFLQPLQRIRISSTQAPAPVITNLWIAPMKSIDAQGRDHLNQAKDSIALNQSTPAIARIATGPITDEKAEMYELQDYLKTANNEGRIQDLLTGHLTMNKYCLERMAPAERAKRNVLNDITLLTLLKLHTPLKKLTDYDIALAFEKTFDFLKNNGLNSEFLTDRLQDIYQTAGKPLQILNWLQAKQSVDVAAKLNHEDIRKYSIPVDFLIRDKNKLTYDITGLNHTLINLNGRWCELFKTFDLNNQHDNNIMFEFTKDHFIPNGQAENVDEQSARMKVRLGIGSFGTVVPAYDIINKKIIAVKKMTNIGSYNADMDQVKKLKGLIPDALRHEFMLPNGSVLSRDKKETFNPKTGNMAKARKAYVGFDLALEPEEFYTVQHNQGLKYSDFTREYEDRAFKQMNLFADKVLLLESLDLVHPDFKPENIFGKRIGDCGDIVKTDSDYTEATHSPSYSIPNLTGKNLSLADKKTINRFSLGATLFFQMTGAHPTSLKAKFDPLLSLKRDIEASEKKHLREEDYYAAEGFPTAGLHQVPDKPTSTDPKSFTAFEKATLRLAKILMAKDRSLASKENLDIKSELEKIGKLRLSQQTHTYIPSWTVAQS